MHRVWALALLTACYRPEALPEGDAPPPPVDNLLDGCPTDYLSFGEGRYRLEPTVGFWEDAFTRCAQDQPASPELHTHLVVITSAAEQDAVGAITTQDFWVGLTDIMDDGVWRHITSEGIDYPGSDKGATPQDPWKLNEPNGSTNENCGIIASINGLPKFDDRPCNNGTTSFRAICECDANEATLPVPGGG